MNEYTTVVVAIASNAIIKLVCFYLGYLTIKLGYNLMTDGIKGQFKFFAEFSKMKSGLISASPGLLFLLLGIILIGYAMSIKKEVRLDSYTEEKNKTHELPFDKKDTVIIDSIK